MRLPLDTLFTLPLSKIEKLSVPLSYNVFNIGRPTSIKNGQNIKDNFASC